MGEHQARFESTADIPMALRQAPGDVPILTTSGFVVSDIDNAS